MKSRVVSDEHKARINAALKSRKVSEEIRDLKREALLGRGFSKENLKKLSLGNTFRQPIMCTNLETGETHEFLSKTGTGKYLGISRVQISHYLDKNIPLQRVSNS